MQKTIFKSLVASSLFATSVFAQSFEAPDTVVVLDVSNSMWGQIEGVSKIEIAREVIGNLVVDLPADTRIGLVAYGHRYKSDCTDIETVLPVGPLNAAEFSAAVNSLVPKGRTPLTDAVRAAADVLNYLDTPSRIILVSDGIESCDADPCALGEELERAGMDFTAHVIGFDVSGIEDQSQLSCLADNTGGKYLTADSADGLLEALQAASETVEIPEIRISLTAPVEVFSGDSFDVEWSGDSKDGDQLVLVVAGDSAAEAIETVAANGSTASFTAPANPDRYEILYLDASGEVVANAKVSVIIGAELQAVAQAIAGSEIEVTWSGPDTPNDYITIVPVGTEDRKFGNYSYTGEGSPLDLLTIDKPGEYEIRYITGAAKAVIARLPITLIESQAEVNAPESASAGSVIDVGWVGPDNKHDYITIVPVGADEDDYGNYEYTGTANPVELLMIDREGEFEIRYISGQSKEVLASTSILLSATPASLEAPSTTAAGAHIDVSWVGPDNQNDYITIVPVGADEDDYGNYEYTRNSNPVELLTEDEAGEFEIRYISGQSKEVLASITITTTANEASLEAPSTAVAGAHIDVSWLGPDNQNDYITIVPAEADADEYGSYEYTRNSNPVELLTEDEAGDYEIRYVSGQSKTVMASFPITLTASEFSLDAPATAMAGSQIDVNWVGPDNQNDYVTIVLVGAKESEYGNYEYTRHANPVDLKTIDAAGDYELRYVSGQSKTVMASIPITLLAPEVSLDAASTALADSEIEVNWIGPNNQNDYIAIVPVGAKDSEYGNYEYTRRGESLEIDTPEAAGAYEIRYISGQSKTVLASTPIEIVAE